MDEIGMKPVAPGVIELEGIRADEASSPEHVGYLQQLCDLGPVWRLECQWQTCSKPEQARRHLWIVLWPIQRAALVKEGVPAGTIWTQLEVEQFLDITNPGVFPTGWANIYQTLQRGPEYEEK